MRADRLLYHSLRASHLLWAWALGVLLHYRLRVPLAAPGRNRLPTNAPSVTVVLPVRDEERNVEACVRSLLAQEYPNFRVLVLDDNSGDRTLQITEALAALDGRLGVMRGKSLPEGWVGKSWASHQAAYTARSEWLLFTDADVRLHPEALTQTVALALKRRADMLSVVQHLECRTFWEKVLQPAFAAFVLCVRPAFLVNSRRSRVSYATGQFILVRSQAYERSGGYAAVRGDIADDVALARLLKRGGYELLLVNATELVRVRMYHGLGEVWAGWRKSLYAASGSGLPLAAATVLLLNITSVLPPMVLAGRLFGLRGAVVRPAAVSVLLMLLARLSGDRLLRVSPLYGPLQPLAAVIICANYLASTWRHLTGKGQEWKGRTYGRR